MSDHAVITVLLCVVVIEGAAIVVRSGRTIEAVAPRPTRWLREWAELPDRPLEDWLPADTDSIHTWLASTDGAPVEQQGHGTPVPQHWHSLSIWAERIRRGRPRVLPVWWGVDTDELQAVLG